MIHTMSYLTLTLVEPKHPYKSWFKIVEPNMALSYFLTFFFALVVYTLAIAFYRVRFHPLHGYPGPRLAAVSELYRFYFDMISRGGGEIVNHLEELHAIYGPVVRISPNEVRILTQLFLSLTHAYTCAHSSILRGQGRSRICIEWGLD